MRLEYLAVQDGVHAHQIEDQVESEIRAFAGAGWSTRTPDRGQADGEMRLENLPGLLFFRFFS